MTILDELKESFQTWIQNIKEKIDNSTFARDLLKAPSENIEDYYYDQFQEEWIYKDKITQIGFENILNLTKISIDAIDANIENLQAIIANINTISIDTTNLQAIISDISSMNVNTDNLQAIIANIGTINTNITNLQAIITDIANMNINVDNLQAIISNIGTMNANITNLQAIITDINNLTAIISNVSDITINTGNLQAIISDIANIETQIIAVNSDTTNLQAIITNIESLTAIIANIGTMNTNITNLQAIISDIANIETQNISMNTALATINTNIGLINTAITQINAHQADIDINIESVKDLDIEISGQENKGTVRDTTIDDGNSDIQDYDTDDYLFNKINLIAFNTTDNTIITVAISAKVSTGWITLHEEYVNQGSTMCIYQKKFDAYPHIRINITNNSGYTITMKYVLFFSKKYTDAEVEALILVHKNLTNAHHIPTVATAEGIESNNLIFSNDTERTTLSLTYVKLKEITIYRKCNIRIYWQMKSLGFPDTYAYSKVYINGIAVGVEKSNNSSTYIGYSEDYSLEVGDILQIYGKTNNSGRACYIQYQRIQSSEYVSTAGY